MKSNTWYCCLSSLFLASCCIAVSCRISPAQLACCGGQQGLGVGMRNVMVLGDPTFVGRVHLHAVMRCAAAGVRRCALHGAVSVRMLFLAGLLICTVLLLLVCGDMHFTARFFHMPSESFWGAISGLGILQLPICWWLLRGFSTPAPHAAP